MGMGWYGVDFEGMNTHVQMITIWQWSQSFFWSSPLWDGFPSWVSHSRHSHKDFHGMAIIHTRIVHCGHGFARAAPRSARFMAQLQGFSGLWKSASRLDLRWDAEITRDHRSHDPDVNMDEYGADICAYIIVLVMSSYHSRIEKSECHFGFLWHLVIRKPSRCRTGRVPNKGCWNSYFNFTSFPWAVWVVHLFSSNLFELHPFKAFAFQSRFATSCSPRDITVIS